MRRSVGFTAALLLGLLTTCSAAAHPGGLDVRFGRGGIVTTDVGENTLASAAEAVLLQSDGRILAAGWASRRRQDIPFPYSDFAVARLLRDGQLDQGFAAGGTATVAVAGIDTARAISVQPDGKIVLAGTAGVRILLTLTPFTFGLACLDASGRLVETFGRKGRVSTSFPGSGEVGPYSHINATLLQDDGKIVAAGELGSSFALVRYETDGTVDTTFGEDGFVVTAFDEVPEALARITAVARDPDGRIAVVGVAAPSPDELDGEQAAALLAVARYDPAGRLDATFGSGGKALGPFPGTLVHAGFLADGGIVAVGYAPGTETADTGWVVARYLSDATLDTSFGVGGVALTQLTDADDRARAVAADALGRLVVTGCAACDADLGWSPRGFSVARYLIDGRLDPAFGAAGVAITAVGDEAAARAVAVQADGRIVIAGSAREAGAQRFALARYLGDELPEPLVPRFGSLRPPGTGLPRIGR